MKAAAPLLEAGSAYLGAHHIGRPRCRMLASGRPQTEGARCSANASSGDCWLGMLAMSLLAVARQT